MLIEATAGLSHQVVTLGLVGSIPIDQPIAAAPAANHTGMVKRHDGGL